MEICKGMPALKQAGKITQERLIKHLAPYSYKPVCHTPSLWRHRSRPVTFALVIDNFGIKFKDKEHFKHLTVVLGDRYDVT